MDQTDSCRRACGVGGGWWKEGEGTSPRAGMNDAWVWITKKGLNCGLEVWAGWRRAKGEKDGTTVIE